MSDSLKFILQIILPYIGIFGFAIAILTGSVNIEGMSQALRLYTAICVVAFLARLILRVMKSKHEMLLHVVTGMVCFAWIIWRLVAI